jgi:hypothetical protein
LFIRTVYCHHGMPASLVSDRDTRFTSAFWASLCEQLGVKRQLSTANHPQTDGQTERVNRILEEYLRAYVGSRQDNWAQLLPLAEFAYNSSVQQSTGLAPFQMVYGHIPASPADIQAEAIRRQAAAARPAAADASAVELDQQQQQQQAAGAQPLEHQQQQQRQRHKPRGPSGGNRAAEELVEQLQANWALAKQHIQQAQQRQAAHANRRRSDVEFKAGDQVLLNIAHIRDSSSIHGSVKLHKKWLGPFTVICMRGPNAAELQLPDTMRQIHPVINVSMLRHHRQSAAFGQREQPPPDPVMVDGEEEFEVEDILDMRKHKYGRGERVEYLVLWKGYPEWEASWVPKGNLKNAPDILHAFHHRVQATNSLMGLVHGF